jgi:microcystin-dependent protein
MPVGSIIPWPGIVLPPGGNWLICDGTIYWQWEYPELFAVIGFTYGAAPPGNFFVPDCRARMTVGAGTAVALAANDGLAAPGRNPIRHLHVAVGNSGNSAPLNVPHNLSDSGPPAPTIDVDVMGALMAAGPDHVHTAPAVDPHTLGAHQHSAGNTPNLNNFPPNQWIWRIIRARP